MSEELDQFARVRHEPDPLRRAKLASELMTVYQQRAVELARLRKEAINQAADEHGMSFATIAAQLRLTRGRITQIRQTAPPAERAFFGVGPVTVATPLRQMPGRALPVISSEDARAAERLQGVLTDLAFHVESFRIPVDGVWAPGADTVAICGPKSSSTMAGAIARDPYLSFGPDETGKWVIRDRITRAVYESPMDQANPDMSRDAAYVGRLRVPGAEHTMLVIAGTHAWGSVGAVDHLARNLPELYKQVGEECFSMVVASRHDGDTVIGTDLLCPPRVHR